MAIFEPGRTSIVDENQGRLLIRSNLPILEDGSFAYEEIQEAIRKDLSSYDQLLDVSVIDCVGERPKLALETAAFGIDIDQEIPTSVWPPYLHDFDVDEVRGDGSLRFNGGVRPGGLIWWPFEGLPEGQDPAVFLRSPGWNFAGIVDYVIQLFTEEGPSRAVLFHCMLGADRTGALHRGYLMRAKKKDFEEACRISDSICGPPNSDYERLSKAYWVSMKDC